MNIKSSANQDKSPTIDGMLMGGTLAFWSSLIYTILILVYITISLDVLNNNNPVLLMMPLVFFMFILGIIPATLLGSIGGAVIGFILSLWKKRLPNILGGLIGLLVGIVLVLTINYLLWYFFVYGTDSFYDTLKLFILRGEAYILSNIIAILFSPYVGWRINTTKNFKYLQATKELS